MGTADSGSHERTFKLQVGLLAIVRPVNGEQLSLLAVVGGGFCKTMLDIFRRVDTLTEKNE